MIILVAKIINIINIITYQIIAILFILITDYACHTLQRFQFGYSFLCWILSLLLNFINSDQEWTNDIFSAGQTSSCLGFQEYPHNVRSIATFLARAVDAFVVVILIVVAVSQAWHVAFLHLLCTFKRVPVAKIVFTLRNRQEVRAYEIAVASTATAPVRTTISLQS